VARQVVDSVLKGVKQGWSNLPLLLLIVLPFYTIEGTLMRLAQIQLFQYFALLCFVITRGMTSSWTCPAGYIGFLALIQVLYIPANEFFLFQVQMICLGYIFFEGVVKANLGYKALRNAIFFFLTVTILFSIHQKYNVMGFLPAYLTADDGSVVQGIWTGQAFCAAVVAMCVPFIFGLRTRAKYFILIPVAWILYETDSDFAKLACLLSTIWFFFLTRDTKKLIGSLVCTMVMVIIYFAMRGDLSSEYGRMYIWGLTYHESLKAFWQGHGFGSFQAFGFEHILVTWPDKGLFFADAHCEYLQMFHEGGILGLILSIWVLIWVILTGLRQRTTEMAVISSSCLVFCLISMGQSIAHAVNVGTIGIYLMGTMESKRRNVC